VIRSVVDVRRVLVYTAAPGAEDVDRLALGIVLGTHVHTEERP